MNISYFVRYEGALNGFAEFLSYYRRHHVPVLARFPGIRRIVLHTPADSPDPFPVNADRFVLIVQMIFDSREDLKNALHSHERAIAREDFKQFPSFNGIVYHQAAFSEEVFHA